MYPARWFQYRRAEISHDIDTCDCDYGIGTPISEEYGRGVFGTGWIECLWIPFTTIPAGFDPGVTYSVSLSRTAGDCEVDAS
jgi:hypothetical protein